MRKIVCSVFALCCCSLVLAQEKTRSLSVELLGAQNVVGVNYDSRFKGNSGWGYRVGIGYGYGDNSSWIDQKISGVGVPLELNYLLGEKKSKLEVGFGASLGMYHIKGHGSILSPCRPRRKKLQSATNRRRTVSAISCLATSAIATSVPTVLCFA